MQHTFVRQLTEKSKILEDINHFLREYGSSQQDLAQQSDPRYAELWNGIATLLESGGKRLRPYLVLVCYEICAKRPYEAPHLQVATTLELLHLAMLIHDDIIDRDDRRYGIDNISGRYKQSYASHLHDETERTHFATSAALLAGDVLLSESYGMLAASTIEPEVKSVVSHTFRQAVFTVIGGELGDTEASFLPHPLPPLTIAEQKTASYSFVAPLLIGAQLAGASQEDQACLRTFAMNLGIAYQLKMIYSGLWGDEAITGKSNENDIREGKKTLIITAFDQRASAEQKTAFYATFGRHDASSKEVAHAKDILDSCGAREYVETELELYIDKALQALAPLEARDASIEPLKELVRFTSERVR